MSIPAADWGEQAALPVAHCADISTTLTTVKAAREP
jgi:hypothetical protein